jgi:hypothetical protein
MDKKGQIDICRHVGYTVVATDWAFMPFANTPAPASANSTVVTGRPSSALTSPQSKTAYGVCWVDSDPLTAYFSAPFEGANPNYPAWVNGFTSYLKKNYALHGFVRCNKLNSLDEAQNFLQQRADQLRPTHKIIETRWKYTPDQAVSASQPAAASVAPSTQANANQASVRTPPAAPGASAAPSPARAPNQETYICMGQYYLPAGGYAFYRTDAFQTSAELLQKTVGDAWRSYMSKTYPDHFGDNASAASAGPVLLCQQFLKPARPIQPAEQRFEAWAKGSKEAIHVDWKYTPDQSGAVAKPAQAAAPEAMPEGKGYCQENLILAQVFDCDCFAKMVHDYRIKHPEDVNERTGRPAPIPNIMTKLDCRQCVSDERITKWVTEEAQRSLANGWSGAQVKAITECTARTLIGDLRSEPEFGDIAKRYNLALSTCTK